MTKLNLGCGNDIRAEQIRREKAQEELRKLCDKVKNNQRMWNIGYDKALEDVRRLIENISDLPFSIPIKKRLINEISKLGKKELTKREKKIMGIILEGVEDE